MVTIALYVEAWWENRIWKGNLRSYWKLTIHNFIQTTSAILKYIANLVIYSQMCCLCKQSLKILYPLIKYISTNLSFICRSPACCLLILLPLYCFERILCKQTNVSACQGPTTLLDISSYDPHTASIYLTGYLLQISLINWKLIQEL